MGIGKLFIILGVLLVIVGILFSLKIQIPWLGRLPGDISVKKDNFSFYFPLTTCLLLSVILSVILRFFKK